MPKGSAARAAGVLETTFTEETETDLFGEQAVLCGGVSELIKAGFENADGSRLPTRGRLFRMPPRSSSLIVDLIYRGGLSYMRYSVSDTAEQGDYSAGPRINHQADAGKKCAKSSRKSATAVLQKAWVEENEKGCPNFLATRQREQQHTIEQLGPKLRAMMPFLQPVIAPGLESKAARSKK